MPDLSGLTVSPGNDAMMSTIYQDTANSFQGSGVTTDTVQSNIKKLSQLFTP